VQINNLQFTLWFVQQFILLQEDRRAFKKYCKREDAQRRRDRNPGKGAALMRERRKKYPERDKESRERFSAAHPGYWNERQRLRNQTPEGKSYRKNYENARYADDVQWKIKKNLNTSILQALKRTKSKKHARSSELLGCDLTEFISHIEKQFSSGQSWENHGTVWHLDHIRPKRSFDLTDPAQQKACFHFSNWRPLGAFENQSKGAKWNGKDWRFE
jgi:hypothetical protein